MRAECLYRRCGTGECAEYCRGAVPESGYGGRQYFRQIWIFGCAELFLALDTEVELVHAGRMPLAEFACSKRDRDVLVRLIVKKHEGVTVYQSHRNSRTDFPVLTCAVRVEDGKGCAVLGARPAKAARVELPAELAEKLAAGKASAEELKAAASEISDQFTYGSNMRGSAEYRHHLGRVLLRRCMEEIQKKEEQ